MTDRPKLGYLIGSHVAYQHKAVPRLIDSMLRLGISSEAIIVNVNGSAREHRATSDGVTMFFTTGERSCPCKVIVDHELAEWRDIHYWLLLNCTSECGPKFRELAEAGFDPEADATLAGAALSLGPSGGKWGRAINDLAVYKASYLEAMRGQMEMWETASPEQQIVDLEGYLFAHAPIQAAYPMTGYDLDRSKRIDVYGTGVLRATEYYPGLDLYRFKKNFGQLGHSDYTIAEL